MGRDIVAVARIWKLIAKIDTAKWRICEYWSLSYRVWEKQLELSSLQKSSVWFAHTLMRSEKINLGTFRIKDCSVKHFECRIQHIKPSHNISGFWLPNHTTKRRFCCERQFSSVNIEKGRFGHNDKLFEHLTDGDETNCKIQGNFFEKETQWITNDLKTIDRP